MICKKTSKSIQKKSTKITIHYFSILCLWKFIFSIILRSYVINSINDMIFLHLLQSNEIVFAHLL